MKNYVEQGMTGVTIQESEIELTYGRIGKVAVLMYVGERDPIQVLDEAVSLYVGYEQYFQFVDINMDSPGIRVVMSNLNDMKQEAFDSSVHHLKGQE